MLCKANVHLSDWPLDERRDVDADDEVIRGLLRVGYIVPLVLPRSAPQDAPSSEGIGPDTELSPDGAASPEKPAQARKRRASS